MLILEVSKVSKNFGYGTLFKNLSFSLNEGEKISVCADSFRSKSTKNSNSSACAFGRDLLY